MLKKKPGETREYFDCCKSIVENQLFNTLNCSQWISNKLQWIGMAVEMSSFKGAYGEANCTGMQMQAKEEDGYGKC